MSELKRPKGPSTTAQIIHKMHNATNPVTRWVYAEILGNRIDRALNRATNKAQ